MNDKDKLNELAKQIEYAESQKTHKVRIKKCEQINNFLRQSLQTMGNDCYLMEARNHILKAIDVISKHQNKRINLHNQSVAFAEQAKQNYQNWMNKIKEGALKFNDELKSLHNLDN